MFTQSTSMSEMTNSIFQSARCVKCSSDHALQMNLIWQVKTLSCYNTSIMPRNILLQIVHFADKHEHVHFNRARYQHSHNAILDWNPQN